MAYCFCPGNPQQYVLHGLWMGADIAGLSRSIAGGVSPVALIPSNSIPRFLMSLWFGRRYCKSQAPNSAWNFPWDDEVFQGDTLYTPTRWTLFVRQLVQVQRWAIVWPFSGEHTIEQPIFFGSVYRFGIVLRVS